MSSRQAVFVRESCKNGAEKQTPTVPSTVPYIELLLVCSVSSAIESLTCPRYPTYTSVLLRAIEWWYHDPNVSTPVLKLMAELVQNRSQRLHFDVSSPNGILLFRVTSEMIVAYGMEVTD